MENAQCPDFSSHSDNAYDQWINANAGRKPQTSDDYAEIDALAECEYHECEGHVY